MSPSIEKWNYFEFTIQAKTTGNPFLDVTFEAEFRQGHRSIVINGFYDGDDTYRVRCMPDVEGTWRFSTRSNVDALNGVTGEFECVTPKAGNHGPVRVVGSTHFAYADGTPYHPVGTTCYVWNHQGDELENQTIATLKEAPFNKMRMCVFPKRYVFNKNEPSCYPFEGEVTSEWDEHLLDDYRMQPPPDFWDFERFNPAYFHKLEKHILDLCELGIEADLILFHPYDYGAWGFDRMPAEVNARYLRYLTARLSALRNVWWSFANEYDLMPDYDLNDWDGFFKLVQQNDPYDHLRSIHNCFGFYDHSKPWVTHASIQYADLLEMPAWLNNYKKPVVVDECGYEGDIIHAWGSLSAESMVEKFWLGFASGGYVGHGETYMNTEEVLWWSKGGVLHGESPARIAFLRDIIEDVPAPGLSSYSDSHTQRQVIPQGSYMGMACGHVGDDYLLHYFARNQPKMRYFNLPEGEQYQVDIIDTWNMTITPADFRVLSANDKTVFPFKVPEGRVAYEVKLPGQNYLAIRVRKV